MGARTASSASAWYVEISPAYRRLIEGKKRETSNHEVGRGHDAHSHCSLPCRGRGCEPAATRLHEPASEDSGALRPLFDGYKGEPPLRGGAWKQHAGGPRCGRLPTPQLHRRPEKAYRSSVPGGRESPPCCQRR